tara:strand:+ start:6155 stop:7324 length:1170 start_codon:yes stop_codon:yes gene_type:complete
MSEVKQEGEFKMQKRKASPKKLNKPNETIKVDLAVKVPPVEADLIKVVIPSEPVEKDKETIIVATDVVQVNPEAIDKEVGHVVVMHEITDEEVALEATKLQASVDVAIIKTEDTGKQLPDNIQKVVDFMHDTGGNLEDYVRLNADYSNVNNDTLLKEYYKKTKPHLDNDEIDFLLEDNFSYDEDIDDERDVRKRKLALKEEVAKAKGYLETVKSKYYDEVKLRPGVNKEQQGAVDFFNRYKKDQEVAETNHVEFKTKTKQLFSQDFKGFDFNLGDKKFRYGVQNPSQVADSQSDISNIIGKFLGEDGTVKDVSGYHKAMYAASNADKLAQHFYEQGRADAVKEVVSNSKNPSLGAPRQSLETGFVNGFKVKSVSSLDSSKLKIQTKKFN